MGCLMDHMRGESLLVDAPEGADLLRISERRFHELRREPGFPEAVVLGARCVRWHRDELATYAKGLPRVPLLPEPPHMERRRAAARSTARQRQAGAA